MPFAGLFLAFAGMFSRFTSQLSGVAGMFPPPAGTLPPPAGMFLTVCAEALAVRMEVGSSGKLVHCPPVPPVAGRSAEGAGYLSPGALLGICEWHVERRMSLKTRVSACCARFMNVAALLGEAQTLAEQIRKKRVALGMSQRGLASELGVHPFTISAWERGRRKPRAWNRQPLARWLGFDTVATLDGLAR